MRTLLYDEMIQSLFSYRLPLPNPCRPAALHFVGCLYTLSEMGASGLPPWSKLHGGTPLYQPHPRHELAVPSRPGRHHHRLDLLHTGTGSMPWRALVAGVIAPGAPHRHELGSHHHRLDRLHAGAGTIPRCDLVTGAIAPGAPHRHEMGSHHHRLDPLHAGTGTIPRCDLVTGVIAPGAPHRHASTDVYIDTPARRPGRHHHHLDLLHTGTGSMPWRDLVTGAIARAVDNFATITPLTNAHFLSI